MHPYGIHLSERLYHNAICLRNEVKPYIINSDFILLRKRGI
ncbi:hypothetical protein HMPREF1250_1988 [Megasphaera vaginalis (ex Srinivasan et al. 2021)]|uniref:Uncharacterized protein n=1 Tax=Megasphaera vaginalis (ex Srinivasan et al. 2021) TaxID=1111454 RepID=U7URJ3_9FIRM|nr:hypothetical protein HMPREF1250_1988 [Megasphaera vaginalis (ex Srinivasan et al. 2021)]